ncbi:MAG TPA: alpha/beta hydrolase [Actinomycetota bacterium]|nr:alpha/beta hydrolase [Actinomycetota bacterium]
MSGRRTAFVTTGLAFGAVAGGVVARAALRRRRDPEAGEPLSLPPPEDLGPVESFDGTPIAVPASGDPSSPVLVFVHGFSLDMTSWHYQWTALSERFRCVLFDLRSHGRSGRARGGDLSPGAMASDLAAVIEAIAPDGAVVVGHSLGGMSILAAADAHPELFGAGIRGVALVGSAAAELLRGAMGSITGMLRPRLGTLVQAARRVDRLRRAVLAGPADIGRLIARMTQFGPDAPPHVVNYVVGLAGRAPAEVWTEGLAELMSADVRPALNRVVVPALVVVGDHDRVTPPASAIALAAALPNARLEVVEQAGHMAMMERPDVVNERLAAFADEIWGRS